MDFYCKSSNNRNLCSKTYHRHMDVYMHLYGGDRKIVILILIFEVENFIVYTMHIRNRCSVMSREF
jgi:penicillin-binding protein-related factor A (putative recombinase)